MAILHDQPNKSLHMFQLSRFEQVAPVLRGEFLPSCFFLKSPVLRWSWVECQILFILQVSLTFYKLTVKTLAVSKLGGCRCCSWSPSLSLIIDPSQQKTLFVWALVKEVPGTGLWINTVCNFQTRKSVVQLNRMLWKFLLLCQGIQENSHKDNVKSNFLGKIWESKKSSRLYFSLSGYQRP